MAIVAFAVGIGSATAIFTIINGVMLRPLPYPQGDRIAMLFGANTNEPGRYSTSTFVDLIEYERRTTSLRRVRVVHAGQHQPEHVRRAPVRLWRTAVTPSLAHNIGVNPRLGRWFTDDSGVVISDALWKRLGSRTEHRRHGGHARWPPAHGHRRHARGIPLAGPRHARYFHSRPTSGRIWTRAAIPRLRDAGHLHRLRAAEARGVSGAGPGRRQTRRRRDRRTRAGDAVAPTPRISCISARTCSGPPIDVGPAVRGRRPAAADLVRERGDAAAGQVGGAFARHGDSSGTRRLAIASRAAISGRRRHGGAGGRRGGRGAQRAAGAP